MKSEGSGRRSPALNCSLEKQMELSPDLAVDMASPSSSRMDTPFGMPKQSWNSFSFRSLVRLARPPEPPCPAAPVVSFPFFEDIVDYTKPNVLALPQRRIGNPQKVQGGNRNPRTSLADEDTQRAEDRALPAEMQKRKIQA